MCRLRAHVQCTYCWWFLLTFAFLSLERSFVAVTVCKQPLRPGNGQLWYVCSYSEGRNATIRARFSSALRNGDVSLPQAHLFPCRLLDEAVAWRNNAVRRAACCAVTAWLRVSSPWQPNPAPARSSALRTVQLQTQLWDKPGNTMCNGLRCQTEKVHPGICKTCAYEIR